MHLDVTLGLHDHHIVIIVVTSTMSAVSVVAVSVSVSVSVLAVASLIERRHAITFLVGEHLDDVVAISRVNVDRAVVSVVTVTLFVDYSVVVVPLAVDHIDLGRVTSVGSVAVDDDRVAVSLCLHDGRTVAVSVGRDDGGLVASSGNKSLEPVED